MSVRRSVPPFAIFKTSEYAEKQKNISFVKYKKVSNRSYEILKNANFNQAEEFNGKPLDYYTRDLVKEFNNYNKESELLKLFAKYVEEHISATSYDYIIKMWPPVVPLKENSDTILLFLVKLLTCVKKPSVVTDWLSTEVFPTSFKPNLSERVIAITKCILDNNKKRWAVLTSEKKLTLYSFEDNKQIIDKSCVIDEIQADINKGHVKILSSGRVFTSFTPLDPVHAIVWSIILTKGLPFAMQLTSFAMPIVDDFYKTMLDEVTESNFTLVRAIINPKVSDPESSGTKLVLKRILDVCSYRNKQYAFMAVVFTTDLEKIKEEDLIPFLEGQSNSRSMVEIVIQKFGGHYTNNFMKRLITFIDNNGNCGIGTKRVDMRCAEKFIVTLFKLICKSHVLIPNEVKQTLNIFKTYLALKTNSKEVLYRVVTETFIKLKICAVLNNIRLFNIELKNPDIFAPISRMIYTIISHGKLEGEFAPLRRIQKRLELHVYKYLYEFTVEASEYSYDVKFAGKGTDEIAKCLEEIAIYISNSGDFFNRAYRKAQKHHNSSIIGTNISALLLNFFGHSGDADELIDISKLFKKPKQKKHAHKYIKVGMVDNLEGKIVKNIVRIDPNKPLDPTKKYYKRVRRRLTSEEQNEIMKQKMEEETDDIFVVNRSYDVFDNYKGGEENNTDKPQKSQEIDNLQIKSHEASEEENADKAVESDKVINEEQEGSNAEQKEIDQ